MVDALQTNPSVKNDFGDRAGEMRYDSTNTTPGQTIAKDIAINWKPMQTHRWPQEPEAADTQWAGNDEEWVQERDRWKTIMGKLRRDSVVYIIVKGHLNVVGESLDTDTLLSVTVLQQTRDQYQSEAQQSNDSLTGRAIIAERNLTRSVATLYVTKAMLEPADGLSWDAYQEVGFAVRGIDDQRDDVDMTQNLEPTSIGAQLEGNSSRRLNLEVRWLGGEPVVLRSVSIRDSLGDLMLGDESRVHRGQERSGKL